MRKIYALCYWKEWMKKEGSSLALAALMGILPADFFRKYELPIVKALIYALNTLPEFITVTAHYNCPKTLYKLIKTCHNVPNFILVKPRTFKASAAFLEYIKRIATATGTDPEKLEKDYVSDFREMCRRLTQELQSERKFTRKISRECLKRLEAEEKLPLEELLNIDSARYVREGEENVEGKSLLVNSMNI